MGIFGWSLPPGVTHVPGDEPERCMVCGLDPSDCSCPECPECGQLGCFDHLPAERKAEIEARWEAEQKAEAEAEARYYEELRAMD